MAVQVAPGCNPPQRPGGLVAMVVVEGTPTEGLAVAVLAVWEETRWLVVVAMVVRD